MNEKFRLGIYHPDNDKHYLIESVEDFKKIDDGYLFPIEWGGCCNYIYYNDYTKNKVKKLLQRKIRYWRNKEEENIRSKIWRLNQKLKKLKGEE